MSDELAAEVRRLQLEVLDLHSGAEFLEKQQVILRKERDYSDRRADHLEAVVDKIRELCEEEIPRAHAWRTVDAIRSILPEEAL